MGQRQRRGLASQSACSGEQAAECSEVRWICWSIPDAFVEVPFEKTRPAPEHHDLGGLVRLRASGRDNEAEYATQSEAEE